MNRKHLAIIGNGMATGRLLDELIRRDGLRHLHVSVFGDEPHGCYNRILLNRVLAGGDVDDITLKTPGWYSERGVTYYRGTKVTQFSQAARRLWTDQGTEHYFDTAIFATGSVPRVPTLDGLRMANGKLKPGAYVYRTVDDVEQMRNYARRGMRAVVVGGGLLGLEAAKGLCDLGLDVTVVHLFDTLMNRQLDAAGGRFLRRSIEQLGIRVRTSMTTKAIRGKSRVEAVEFGGGEKLPADMVIFASGIKARVDLALDSDIPTNAGILVDDQLATQLPSVYAVGECAEHRGIVYGTVQPIYEQCAVLADVLTGVNPQAVYRGSKVYTKLKVAGVAVASMGTVDAERLTDEVVQITEERRGAYRKLVIRDDVLIGAVLVGDIEAAPTLIQYLEQATPLPANRLDLLASGEGGGATAIDPEVCNCHHVSTSTLVSAIQSGCTNLPALSAQTQAGTGCGSCRGQLVDLILKNSAGVPPGRKEDAA